MSNAAKYFNILATSLSVLHNYFHDSNKIIFRYISNNKLNFYIRQSHSSRVYIKE